MRPDPKHRLHAEIISPTIVIVAVRPDYGQGPSVAVSHKAALEFAERLLADLRARDGA
jgi:hypothetical protein